MIAYGLCGIYCTETPPRVKQHNRRRKKPPFACRFPFEEGHWVEKGKICHILPLPESPSNMGDRMTEFQRTQFDKTKQKNKREKNPIGLF